MRLGRTPRPLRPRQRALVAVVAVAAVALPLAASSIAAARSGSTSAGPASAIATPPDPVPAAPVSVEERRVLDRAEALLTRDCMTRAGFQLWLVQPPSADELRTFPYLVDDVAWARKHGFGSDVVEAMSARRLADPNQRYVDGLSRTQGGGAGHAQRRPPGGPGGTAPLGRAMRRSAEGCTSEAQRRLYGDLAGWYRSSKVVADLTYLRQRRVLADPAWTAALRPWARCLRQQGTPPTARNGCGRTSLNGAGGRDRCGGRRGAVRPGRPRRDRPGAGHPPR
ncbi:hypothetical protein NKG94_00465 [Micromonospora sp. M12]